MATKRRKPRLDHGMAGYARVEATDVCVECKGPLGYVVPNHAEFHKMCDACLQKSPWASSDITIEITRKNLPPSPSSASSAPRGDGGGDTDR